MTRDALDGAPRNVCYCGEAIAKVDSTTKKDRKTKQLVTVGGQWVHVELPATVHPARPA